MKYRIHKSQTGIIEGRYIAGGEDFGGVLKILPTTQVLKSPTITMNFLFLLVILSFLLQVF